jgi:acyl-coenzyme A thioesterase PaaI-like protein
MPERDEELVIMSTVLSMEKLNGRLHARAQSACFVCGQDNEHGLRIRFRRETDGEITAEWMPDSVFEGFRGIVHGGVVSTVLDEAMSKAVAATGTEALTAELRVRFRHHVTIGDIFQVRGWIVKRNKRLIDTEAVLTADDGTEHAHAWARFLSLPQT